MDSKRWMALIIAGALFLFSIGTQLTTTEEVDEVSSDFTGLFNDASFKEKVLKTGTGKDKIVQLNLDGVIQDIGSAPFMNTLVYDHQRFLQMIERTVTDPNVKGVILNVNTPGGGVVESAEIHDALQKITDEDIPLYVSMGNTAASGGYYIAAPATKIVAHPATLTGSIGVIMQNVDISELAESYGIDFNTIKSGEFKDIMSPTRKMTKEEEKILQSMIDDLYDDFVDVIVDGRNMSEDVVRDLGDGRVYTGRQAEQLGLVDDLGTLDDTVNMLKEDYDLAHARVIEYEININLSQFLGFSAQNLLQKDQELMNVLSILKESSGPRLLYLYAG